MSKAPSTNGTSEAGGAPAGRSMVARALVILLVALVIGAECAVAYLYLPASGEATAMAGPLPKAAKSAEAEAASTEGDASGEVEVDLGEYCVTSFQPASNSTLRIDFHLYGSVQGGTDKEFRRLFDENKHRLREQVLVTVRSADIGDLTEASLGLIKRTILDKARKTLGKPILREVIISDYSFIEQ